jgi:hypothetical protein
VDEVLLRQLPVKSPTEIRSSPCGMSNA